ncbi:MAG: hypothetical protein HPY74_14580 [Firmicutes bacterium]|nr:hypothetical protein [Bacillota bacterium]
MKIKIDFVTNSSSESFGIVLVDTASTLIATGAITVMANAVKEMLIGDTVDVAEKIAEAVGQEAEYQSKAIMEGYSEAEKNLEEERKSLASQLEEIKKQWEESEKTADKKDPGYEKLKAQYDEYMKYLENEIKQKDYEKYLIQVEKAEKQAELESKNEWIRQRQVDYIAVKEERALLEATLKGYGEKGYNVKDIEERLKQLDEREKELGKTLAENNASIEYTARDRGVIGPGAEFDKIQKEYMRKKAEIEFAKALADREKRAQLELAMKQAEEEFQEAMKAAARWDLATKAAEGVQFGADMAIEGLSHVTGPAGQQIKLLYKSGKSIASGMGEGMADPKNAGKHLAKGFIGAVTEVAKDKFGENPFKSAIVNVANEGAQGALDAGIKGEDVLTGGLKGLGKGVIDSAADAGLDKIKSKLPIPKGSSVDVHDYSLGQIYNNNPLTKGLTKTVIREGVGDKTKDFIKETIVDNLGKTIGVVD